MLFGCLRQSCFAQKQFLVCRQCPPIPTRPASGTNVNGQPSASLKRFDRTDDGRHTQPGLSTDLVEAEAIDSQLHSPAALGVEFLQRGGLGGIQFKTQKLLELWILPRARHNAPLHHAFPPNP
jgi:hypothetical protein